MAVKKSLKDRVGAAFTPTELAKKWTALQKRRNRNTEAFIAAGRGDERPSEYLRKKDPLSLEALSIFDDATALESEARKYAGPHYREVLERGAGWGR